MKGRLELTITFVFIIIGDQIRALAHPIAISGNTTTVERVLPTRADDTIVACGARACLTRWRARRTRAPAAEAPIRTHCATRSNGLSGNALSFVISTLRKSGLARQAGARTVGT